MTFEQREDDRRRRIARAKGGAGRRAPRVIAKWPSNLDLRNAILACVLPNAHKSRFFLFLTPAVEYRGGVSAWDVHNASQVSLTVMTYIDGRKKFLEISLKIYARTKYCYVLE